MKPICTWAVVLAILLILSNSGSALAGLKDDVGYTQLAEALGTAVPTGSGVEVTQVEAVSSDHWIPDNTNTQFTGKTITDKTGGDTGTSSHATSVGLYFYGNSRSLTPGITSIDAYAIYTSISTGYWLGPGFLMHGVSLNDNPIQPMYQYSTNAASRVLASPSRVANHSWVGTLSGYSDILRRMDYIIEADDFIQVVAVNNGTTQKLLLSGSYNALTVGRTDGGHPNSTLATDSVYVAGRVCPLIVVPLSLTSFTTPVATSAAALLVQAGRDADTGNDPDEAYTMDRSGRSIANAERSETIKAALMAGARRFTYNEGDDDITDYRSDSANCSDNGLDLRYGAGQLDIFNSYRIIAAGEQNSAEDDDSGNGEIASYGFDVDPFFGGSSDSNTVGTYRFTAGAGERRFYAALVWHLDIDGGSWNNFIDTATLYDLDVALYDTTADGEDRRIADSGDHQNNTENIWAAIVPGRSYRLEVTRAGGQADFVWDYAMAWRTGTPLDSDDDGLDDEWEVEYGLAYDNSEDAVMDGDSDGLTALEEYALGTSPNHLDTDGDGSSDGSEVISGTDPLDATDYPRTVSAAAPLALALAMVILVSAVMVIRKRRTGKTRYR